MFGIFRIARDSHVVAGFPDQATMDRAIVLATGLGRGAYGPALRDRVIDPAMSGPNLRAGVPHGHRKRTTFIAGLQLTGLTALMALGGSINTMTIRYRSARFAPTGAGAPEPSDVLLTQ
jgi:hypothetical protein